LLEKFISLITDNIVVYCNLTFDYLSDNLSLVIVSLSHSVRAQIGDRTGNEINGALYNN